MAAPGTVLSQELLEERLQEARRNYKLNVGWAAPGAEVAARAQHLPAAAPRRLPDQQGWRKRRLPSPCAAASPPPAAHGCD